MSQPSNLHMSADTPPTADAGEDDGMNLKLIVVVGVVSLVVFALSAVVAWWILKSDTEHYEAQGLAPAMKGLNSKEEIGMVDFVPFDSDFRLEHWTAEKTKQLNSYGWADRQKKLIHIPIDEAMKDVIRQAGSGSPNTGGAPK